MERLSKPRWLDLGTRIKPRTFSQGYQRLPSLSSTSTLSTHGEYSIPYVMNSLFSYYSFIFSFSFSFSFSTYPTSCSDGTLNPAYSPSWHILPTASSSFPILFCFTPQQVFRYWLAFYLVTFHSTYVIDVPFYYLLHMYLLRFPSQLLVNTLPSLTQTSSTSIDRSLLVKSD